MYSVDFNKLPTFNKLFLDYIYSADSEREHLLKFFNVDYKSNEDYYRIIDNKLQNYNSNRYFDKNQLIDILKRQNVSFGGTEETASNIELLKNENTFAVVTGQQVGLYTGNMYTILKTITAIKLAKEFNHRFSEFRFIPIFWLESDDHDFDEANHIHIIDRKNEVIRIGFETEIPEEETLTRKNTYPVGRIKFDTFINDLNEKLKTTLLHTDFTDKLIGNVKECYKENNDFKHAFAEMMNQLFKDSGLIFLDPDDAEIKKLLIPVFEKELNTSPRLCEGIINTSAELEKDYDVQVKPKVINLFFLHNEQRYLLEPRDNERYALKNSKRRFTKEELMGILFETPENFSGNVVLRPICQDYLLPTIAYVGGPSEISYYAQFKSAYEHYDIPMPVIFPRASVSIIENKIKKFLTNFEINFTTVFHHKKLLSKVVEKLSEIKIDDGITKATDEFNKIFYELKTLTSKIDKTLVNVLDKTKEKLLDNMEQFRGKITNAQISKSETSTAQIDKVMNNLYPHKNLQERHINICYFLNKYDETFMQKLFDEIDINCTGHQVIEI